MNHQKGDLLWIPQAAMLYRGPNKDPMAVMMNPAPKVAIFLDKTDYQDYIQIMIEGQKWIVDEKHTRIIKEKACS